MTMIDEQTLRDALNAAANEFEVSDDAIARILDAASGDEPEQSVTRVRKVVPESRRVRAVIFVAAALVLVTAIAIPLRRSESPQSIHIAGNFAPHGLSGTSTGGQGVAIPSPVYLKSPSKGVTLTGSGFVGEPKIESNGYVNLTVGVGKVPNAIVQLTALVEKDHGYVESSQAQVGSNTARSFATGVVVLEVPEPTFAHFVSQVQTVGHPTSVNTTSNNVTSQYVDLQSKITAANVSLHQYFVIMTRATTIGGILAVQNQINVIQNEIQQDKGQLKALNSETAYSALTVHLTSGAHHRVSGPRTGFKKAWHDSVRGFVAGFQWLLRLAGPLLFALLMLGVMYVLFRAGRRALLRRRLQ
jgi:hypothetical protein